MKADKVYLNGKVYTVNGKDEWAQAVAIKGNEIVYVGSDEGAKAFCGDETEINDMNGGMMLPGFIDGHCHPVMAAQYLCGVYLQIEWTVEECLAEIERFVEDNPDEPTYFGI